MSNRSEKRSDADKELLDLYMKADPETQKAFISALKAEKLNAADIMSMLSGALNDPNTAALFQSMKKVLASGKNRSNESLQQLLAFTFFYSSAIYAMLLCFVYWKWDFDEKETKQSEQTEQSGDDEQ